jgi:hypothetical protein
VLKLGEQRVGVVEQQPGLAGKGDGAAVAGQQRHADLAGESG